MSHRTSISLSTENNATLKRLTTAWGMSASGAIGRLIREHDEGRGPAAHASEIDANAVRAAVLAAVDVALGIQR